jgi:hypothetical protein
MAPLLARQVGVTDPVSAFVAGEDLRNSLKVRSRHAVVDVTLSLPNEKFDFVSVEMVHSETRLEAGEDPLPAFSNTQFQILYVRIRFFHRCLLSSHSSSSRAPQNAHASSSEPGAASAGAPRSSSAPSSRPRCSSASAAAMASASASAWRASARAAHTSA